MATDQRSAETPDPTPIVGRRQTYVETALGNAVAETLRGDSLGGAIVASIDHFVFRDIQTEEEALQIFGFVDDQASRTQLARTFRGARWQQKVGLVLARDEEHPAHAAQVRSQVVEYGAIAELVLRCMLEQRGNKTPPKTFDQIINQSRAASILTLAGAEAAECLRLARNRVHLYVESQAPPVRASREGRDAYKWLVTVINECRANRGLDAWKFGKPVTNNNGSD